MFNKADYLVNYSREGVLEAPHTRGEKIFTRCIRRSFSRWPELPPRECFPALSKILNFNHGDAASLCVSHWRNARWSLHTNTAPVSRWLTRSFGHHFQPHTSSLRENMLQLLVFPLSKCECSVLRRLLRGRRRPICSDVMPSVERLCVCDAEGPRCVPMYFTFSSIVMVTHLNVHCVFCF